MKRSFAGGAAGLLLARGLRPFRQKERKYAVSLVENIAIQPTIASALQSASQRTGVDFDYLLKTAMRESSLDCQAKSKTSSACGLFQFTEQSWLGTMKKHGAALGLGKEAAAIEQNGSRYRVENAAQRAEILALRNDPHVAALMAGAYTQDSASALENRLGRSAGEGELYVAHFLGAGGAAKLITAAEEAPNTRADLLFPAAAEANRSIFYKKDGEPRSAQEVYQNLVSKHEGTDASRIAEEAAKRPANAKRHASVSERAGVLNDLAGGDSRRGYATRGMALGTSSSDSGNAAPASANYGRTPLVLNSTVVEILASLDPIPGSSDSAGADRQSEREAADERREAHRERARLLPRSGFTYG
jgi:hypothetical protein